MAADAITLCSRALLKLGAAPIASFADGTPEVELAAMLYPATRDAKLAAHAWRFATATAESPQRADAAPAGHGYSYAHNLPEAALRVLAVTTPAGARISHALAGTAVYSNRRAIAVRYIARTDPAVWPPYFDEAVTAALAAEMCLPLTERLDRADALHRQAEQALRRARLIDTHQDSPRQAGGFALAEARKV